MTGGRSSDPDELANLAYENDHNHPLFRLSFGVRLMTGKGGDPDSETVSNSHHWAGGSHLSRIKPLRAALGAAFDHCRQCMSLHSTTVAEDPPLVVWLAWSVAAQIGTWRNVPAGRNDQWWRWLANRMDPAAAGLIDALYAGGEDGLAACLQAVKELPRPQRQRAVSILLELVFCSLSMLNMDVDLAIMSMRQ